MEGGRAIPLDGAMRPRYNMFTVKEQRHRRKKERAAMDSFAATLRAIVPHLKTHDEFVRHVMSVGFTQVDCGMGSLYTLGELQPAFQDELEDFIFRRCSGL